MTVTDQPSPAAIVALADGLNPEFVTSLQTLVSRLLAGGYAAAVMAAAGNIPSDHKVWINGAAWTLISSDGFKPGTFRWDPYIQAAAPPGGYSPCGIPLSAGIACPPWFAAAVPDAPPAPAPAPGVDVAARLAAIDAKLDALKAQADANTAAIQTQIDSVVKNAERSASPLVAHLLALGGAK